MCSSRQFLYKRVIDKYGVLLQLTHVDDWSFDTRARKDRNMHLYKHLVLSFSGLLFASQWTSNDKADKLNIGKVA